MAHPGFNLFDVRIYNGDVEAKAPCGTGVESAQLGRRVGGNPPAKLFRNFLKTEIENQKRGSCDFER
jgi:hypothetical protein